MMTKMMIDLLASQSAQEPGDAMSPGFFIKGENVIE